MTIEQLGNLGEFIGPIIVAVTLIVLVFQLKQTKAAVTTNSYLLTASLAYETFDQGTNEFLATALAKSIDGEPLSRGEEHALRTYWRGFIR